MEIKDRYRRALQEYITEIVQALNKRKEVYIVTESDLKSLQMQVTIAKAKNALEILESMKEEEVLDRIITWAIVGQITN